MSLMNTRRSPLRWRAPPGGRSVHPALTTSDSSGCVPEATFTLLVLRVRVDASVTGALTMSDRASCLLNTVYGSFCEGFACEL